MKRTIEIVLIILMSGLLLYGCDMQMTPTIKAPVEDEVDSCREIHAVSDPIIVRDANVGDTGPGYNDSNLKSPIGTSAIHPRAISTDAGILVIWGLSFDGSLPEPNVFMRLLDEHAAPIGEVQNLFERNMSGISYSLLKRENEIVLAFCGRYGHKDKATTVFLNSQGEVLSEQQLPPMEHSCGASRPNIVWTGSRLITVWTDNGTQQVFINVADREGNSLFWKELLLKGDFGPQVVMGHDRVLIVVNPKFSEHNSLMIYRFDLDGNELGDPVIINPLTFERDGEIREKPFVAPYLIPTKDGWMLLSSPPSLDFSPTGMYVASPTGMYVASLNPDGDLVFGPFITGLDLNLRFANGIQQVFPYRQGAIIWGADSLVFISKNGVLNPIVDSSQVPGISYTFFFEHREKLFSVYTKAVDSKTNQVLLREVECTP